MAGERQRHRGSAGDPGGPPGTDRTTTAVSVRFSALELEQLKREAERAGVTVAVLVRGYAIARSGQRPHAIIGSTNAPSNPPSTPETSSGIRVRGYSGTYRPTIGTNR